MKLAQNINIMSLIRLLVTAYLSAPHNNCIILWYSPIYLLNCVKYWDFNYTLRLLFLQILEIRASCIVPILE